ncbi:MAG: hypothetical protein ACLTTU_05605 [Bilophila wadsworthia]
MVHDHHHHHFFFFFFFFLLLLLLLLLCAWIPAPLRHLKDHLSKEGLLPIGKLRIGSDKVESLWGEGRFGEGSGDFLRKSPLPLPIFHPTKSSAPEEGRGLQRKEEDTVSVRRRMTLPLNEQTQLGTCETVRWNRSFKVVEALVYVNGFADYCFP